MEVREIACGSEDYATALEIREVVLRVPLGLRWTADELSGEAGDRHFVLREGNRIVACLAVRFSGRGDAKIRQMAVVGNEQGSGKGRALVEGVRELLRREGVGELWLHSREAVTGFYECLGFQKEGARFEEVGLPHWKMSCLLSARAE